MTLKSGWTDAFYKVFNKHYPCVLEFDWHRINNKLQRTARFFYAEAHCDIVDENDHSKSCSNFAFVVPAKFRDSEDKLVSVYRSHDIIHDLSSDDEQYGCIRRRRVRGDDREEVSNVIVKEKNIYRATESLERKSDKRLIASGNATDVPSKIQ